MKYVQVNVQIDAQTLRGLSDDELRRFVGAVVNKNIAAVMAAWRKDVVESALRAFERSPSASVPVPRPLKVCCADARPGVIDYPERVEVTRDQVEAVLRFAGVLL